MTTAEQIISLHYPTSKEYRQACELMRKTKTTFKDDEGKLRDHFIFLDHSSISIVK